MMAVTETCVTPTDLAAFLEGSVTGEERDRTVRHLNHCPDCFERYIGAARLLDAIEEEEASALSAADGNRAVDPSLLPGLENLKKRGGKLLLMPIALPRWSRRHAWLLPLAAAILAFVGVPHLWNAYLEDFARPASSEPAVRSKPSKPAVLVDARDVPRGSAPLLAPFSKPYEIEWRYELFRAFSALPEARREAFDEEIRHIVPGHQGNGPEGMTFRRQAFQLGARWVDLHPALRSQSKTLTDRALRNLREILPAALGWHPLIERRELPAQPCGRLLFPQFHKPGPLAALPVSPFEEIDACRQVIERVFRDRPEFALGRWTEATRLAIAAGTERIYFTDTNVRVFLELFLKFEEPRLDDGVRVELERAGKLLEGGLSPGEGEALEAVLQDLARFYEMGE